MATKIFVNLPVKDLKRSMEFWQALGYTFNPKFTDDTAACMVITEDIYSMLLTHSKFKEFTPKKISDSNQSTEVLTALSFDSKEEVNRMMENVLNAGGTEARPPDDFGFMYSRSFNDPDGHIWEIFWMDPAAANGAQN
jgi:hypothetical protein